MKRIPDTRIHHWFNLPLLAAAALAVFGATSSRGDVLGVPGATQVEYTFGENGVGWTENLQNDASGHGRTMINSFKSTNTWLSGALCGGSTSSWMISENAAYGMANTAGMATDFQVSIFLDSTPNYPSPGSCNPPGTAIFFIGDLSLQADGNTGDGSMTYYASVAGTRIGTYTAPAWQAAGLMVQKLNNVFSYWVSTDNGTSWSQCGADLSAPGANINFGDTHLFLRPGGWHLYWGYADEFKVVAATAPSLVPAAPTGLGATAGNNTVLLGWTASSRATGYNVKRSTTQGTGYVTIGTASSPTYPDNTVTNGTPYYYVVSATNTAGEGANSAEASATPAPVMLDQTITFALGSAVTKTPLDAAFADTATATSSLAVTYSSDNPGVATVNASGTVTITGLGTAHILADQAGNASFNPAPQVSQTLNVVPRIQNMHDYTFNDNATPAGFTGIGSPTYSGGQLVLDGSSCLTMATPVTATDNFVIEVICTPTVNDGFNFSVSLNDGVNNGWGLLQISGTYLGLAEGAAYLSSAGPATLGTPVRLALVRAGGLTTIYENGVAAVGTPYDGSRATPTTLTIGASTTTTAPFFGGFFKGSIDEVRVFTFYPGQFNPATDLLTGPTTGGGNAYDTWAHNHAGDGAPSDDYNHDGVSNGVAYFMNATGVATNPGAVGNTVTWTYLNAVTSFEVQVSDDLVSWEKATTGVDTALPPGGHVTYTLPTGPGITKKFCRLMVVP